MSVPTPKYEIGQTAYYGDLADRNESIKCPDCLGTNRWSVKTPGGEEFEVACGRCAYGAFTLIKREPVVTEIIIGSVRIDTDNDDDPVMYMEPWSKDGVKSCRLYRERDLYLTEYLALSAAKKALEGEPVNEHQADARRVLTGSIIDERIDSERKSRSEAWSKFDRLRDLLDDREGTGGKETLDAMRKAVGDADE